MSEAGAPIEDRVSAVREGLRSLFPTLFDVAGGARRLQVRMHGFPATRLRIRNDGDEPLRLARIGVETAAGTLPLGALRASGRNVACPGLELARAPGDAELVLELPEPAQMTGIELVGRPERAAFRTWRPAIDACAAREAWQPVYDHASRLAALEQLLAESISTDWGLSLQVQSFINDTVLDIVGGDLSRLMARSHAGAVTGEELRALTRAFSQAFLKELALEWTGHGAQRTFRFWSAEEKRRYLADANALAGELMALSPHVCFGFGAVLAVVRDGDFIPHDDDLDLLIAFPREAGEGIAARLAQIGERLAAAGYRVDGDYLTHRNVVGAAGRSIDVFVGLIEDERVSWFPGPRGTLLTSEIFPAQEVAFCGERCLIPRQPEAYLEKTYGPDWRTPQPGWNHAWDQAAYADLL